MNSYIRFDQKKIVAQRQRDEDTFITLRPAAAITEITNNQKYWRRKLIGRIGN